MIVPPPWAKTGQVSAGPIKSRTDSSKNDDLNTPVGRFSKFPSASPPASPRSMSGSKRLHQGQGKQVAFETILSFEL
ncbi:MAG: hypothetical protein O7D31_07235, partial [Alphaproteobacteria bacterium]|nr:hypothetical protein [Alphaproteobacteria bacterium]